MLTVIVTMLHADDGISFRTDPPATGLAGLHTLQIALLKYKFHGTDLLTIQSGSLF